MKRLFAILLVLFLMIPCAVADDEVYNVSSLTDQQLKTLYKSVKQELMTRKLWDESILPAGMYQAGKNLPEGTYQCIAKKDCAVYYYANYEKFLKNDWEKSFYPEEGSAFVISLYGEIVYFVTCDAIVRPFVGFDW